ncbi:hypothetical protein EDD86DRAFT_53237 [Gorgonomyces haynaldii]|nr:hypothetical protein EDD86DRAFT_53237 [Gorgonomyces haynaldii]
MYLLGIATLNDTLYMLLLIYLLAVNFELLTMGYLYFICKRLKQRFLYFGMGIISCILIGFLICICFLLTVNYECSLSRHLAYGFFLLGFVLYDFYQLLNVQDRTKKKQWLLVGLFIIRLASVVFSVVRYQGVVALPITEGPWQGAGPCKSKIDDLTVYQEHIIVWIYEIALVFSIVQHAHSLTSREITFIDILTNVFDFEAVSFVVYMLSEAVYITLYAIIPAAYISYLNTFYLQLPIALFLANALNAKDKKKMVEKLTEIQRTRMTKSYAGKNSKMSSASTGKSNIAPEIRIEEHSGRNVLSRSNVASVRDESRLHQIREASRSVST